MADVFISYSHQDHLIVDQITDQLTSIQVSYFRDSKDIQWGGRIPEAVRQGLKEAGALIVVISPASFKSHWVPYEIGFGSALELRVMPFLTHPAIELPGYLSDLKYVSSLDEVKTFFDHNKASIHLATQEVNRPNIRVVVKGFLADRGVGNPVSGVSVTAQNHGNSIVYIDGFQIETSDRRNVLVPQYDHLTGKYNGERNLEPGNSYTFHLYPARLASEGVTADGVGRPLFTDKIGRYFYGSAEDFREAIAEK